MEMQNSELLDFVQKASERLDSKRQEKRKKIFVPSLDQEITIRSLSKSEITECMGMEDSTEGDNYTVYLSVVEPNLRDVAVKLKESGKITSYTEIVDIFVMQERTEIVREVMKLSEVLSERKIAVVDEIKN